MPIINREHGLAYFAIPKVASTSIKHVLYELETGRPFSRADNESRHIHRYYRARPLKPGDWGKCDGLWKFAVFRDPVKRVISAYSNRVLHHRALEKERKKPLKAWFLGVGYQPDLEEFCVRIDRYRRFSHQVMHHTRPYSAFVGPDLSRLDAVYRQEELGKLAADLTARLDRPVAFPHLQTGGPKFGLRDLTPAALASLLKFTEPDYRLLGGMYQPPTLADI